MILLVLVIVFGVLSSLGLAISLIVYNKNYGETAGCTAILFGVLLFGLIIASPMIFGDQYSESISLPEKIAALEITIEQQKELLSDLESHDIVMGLEGLEMKKTIQNTILEYNTAIARLNSLNKNVFVYFKPKRINMGY